jgi:predicted nuclease of predicted toxin-antitoxin system
MLLYLDDDSADPLLVRLLIAASHDIQIPADVGLAGKKDPEHLMYAIKSSRVFLTHNHEDFELLHTLVLLVGGHHPGILVVRRDNDPTRDLKPKGIARAIRNLLAAGVPIPDELHILNHWR